MNEETTAPPVPTDKLVRAFIKMRDARSELKTKYEEDDKKIEEQMDVLKAHFLGLCKQAGADSIKTTHGTIIRGKQTRYWTSDWDSMYNLIKEHDAIELLERRIAQKNMAEFLANHPDVQPKGLNANSEYTVTIRRS